MANSKTVLVLGAYGLIGAGIARALSGAGHEIVGLGRSRAAAQRAFPDIRWIVHDIATARTASDWRTHLAGIDIVVNAAGALQQGLKDDLSGVHDTGICALIDACVEGGVGGYVQISAPGAGADADTAFLRTKAKADDYLKASALNWVVLRPGIVIGANAYGGSALVRMLAAVPVVQPLVLADATMQTVALQDVAYAVLAAVEGRVPAGVDADLVEPGSHDLEAVVARFRQWLGFRPARLTVRLPLWSGLAIARTADVLGWLGWRSPLRTTALTVLRSGVTGNPKAWADLSGHALSSLDETLAELPATVQERWFARLYLLLPMMIAVLSAFWIASGAIGFWRREAAALVLDGTALSGEAAMVCVVAGAIADLAVGAAVLVRRLARWACLGMIALTAAYLASGSFLTPHLWADPLGPFVKTVPAAMLALAAWALLEER